MARVKSGFDHGFRSLAKIKETKLPKQGSKLRECYDFLFAHRGTWVKLPYPSRMLQDLTDFYGCEIKKVYGRGKVMLVGEWHGEHYSDYTIEQGKPGGERHNV